MVRTGQFKHLVQPLLSQGLDVGVIVALRIVTSISVGLDPFQYPRQGCLCIRYDTDLNWIVLAYLCRVDIDVDQVGGGDGIRRAFAV